MASDGRFQTSTLADFPDLRRRRGARLVRRCFLVLLFAFIGLGLAGRMGVRSSTVTTSADGYRITVTYAAATRPGLDTPWSIEIRHRTGFSGPVTIAISASYLDMFDKNGGLDPDPTDSRSDGRFVYWTFDPPRGDTLKASLDAIMAMGQQWGGTGHARLMDGDRVVVDTSFHTWVMP
jgi:hypothetical protein